MKKKILALIAVLLCAAVIVGVIVAVANCSRALSMGSLIGDTAYEALTPTLNAPVKVEGLKGTAQNEGNLMVFTDTESGLDTIKVYNIETNTVVATFTETLKVEGESATAVSYEVTTENYGKAAWFWVEKTTAVETSAASDETRVVTIYTAAGAEVASATDDDAAVETLVDLIILDKKAYRVALDGSISHAFDLGLMGTLPDGDLVKLGDKGYAKGDSNTIYTYDAEMKLTKVYTFPSYAEEKNMALLNDGTVLIQYFYVQDFMAEEYTFMCEGAKYLLCSFLLDAEDGDLEEVELDYVLAGGAVTTKYTSEKQGKTWIYDEDVENIVDVYFIEDQLLDKSAGAKAKAVVDNDGDVVGTADGIVVGMETITSVAPNRWAVTNKVGQTFLVNEDGDVIGEIPAISAIKYNAIGFIYEDKIYNWDLEEKYDLEENEIADEEILENSFMLTTEDDAVILYKNNEKGEPTTTVLLSKDEAASDKKSVRVIGGANLYGVDTRADDGKSTMVIYNDLGTALLTVADFDDYDVARTYNGFVLLEIEANDANGEAVTSYYRFAA